MREKACYNVLRRTARTPGLEGNIDDFVAIERASIPAAVLGDEDTAAIAFRKTGSLAERHAQRRDVRAQGVVRRHGLRNKIRPLRLHADVHMLAEIAVRPSVKSTLTHRSEIVGDQVWPDLVAFVDDRPKFAGLGLEGDAGRVA